MTLDFVFLESLRDRLAMLSDMLLDELSKIVGCCSLSCCCLNVSVGEKEGC